MASSKPIKNDSADERHAHPSQPTVSVPGRQLTLFASGVVVALGLLQPAAYGGTSTKQNNSTALNLAASWDALPGSRDIAQWTSLVNAANSPALGADLSLMGIKIASPGGIVTLAAGNTLTVGAAGIDLSTATQNLTLNCGLTVQGQQSWKAAPGRVLDVAGVFTRRGATVDFTNFDSTAGLASVNNDPSGILGPWATTGSSSALNYAKSAAGSVSAYTAQTLATAGNLSNVSAPTANYSFASAATLTGAITGNTLRFSGSSGTLANAGFTTTLNGLMNAGTTSLASSGTGNLVIGALRELVIFSNGQPISIFNPIVNSSSGASSLAYSGANGASLTLSGVNTYTGGTIINRGTLALGVKNGLGPGPLTLAAGSAFQQLNFEGNGPAGSLPNPLILGEGGNAIMNLSFGGSKDVWLGEVVSGTGGLTVQGGGRKLTLTASNTFSGGIKLTSDGNAVQIANSKALGSGTFRSESGISAASLIPLADLATGTGLTNAFDIASGAYLNIDTSASSNAFNLLLSGPLSSAVGVGNLHKSGGGTLTLTGANTYTGTTRISAGTLALTSAGSLGGGPLDISSGAFLALNFSGTRRVSSLKLNSGIAQVAGTYGASGSGATNTSASFTGTGTVTVGGSPFAVTTTTLAITAGGNPSGNGSSLTFTATVAGSAPNGNVLFYDGVTLIGTQALNGSAQANFTTSTLSLGSHQISARYVGNTANDPSVSAVTTLQVTNPTDILSFTFPGLPVTTIAGTSITVTVPFSTNVATLSPTFTLSAGASCQTASGTTLNFSSPQSYVVTAPGFPNKIYTVTVSRAPVNSAADILSCNFGSLGPATVVGTTITLDVLPNQVVTSLAPTFALSASATLNPPSGTGRNFSTPQTYTVTAENGAIKTYTVTVRSYDSWANSASFFILTTPEGANIPAGASETNFPILLRLNASNFTFSQAQSDGRDIRFTTPTGTPLAYQIEQWDSSNSVAAVWIKIPVITGNASQEVKMYWGKSNVLSESRGSNVFNSANGYVSVMHLNDDSIADSVGTLTPNNLGTTGTNGLIGGARNFVVGNGIDCGSGPTSLPSGNVPHSTGIWYRSNTSGFDIFDWGSEDQGKKVQIRLVSPPRIVVDGNFAGVESPMVKNTLAKSEWHHVVNTYSAGVSTIYVDGQLIQSASAEVDIIRPSRMQLGGWYRQTPQYKYVGEMDEARLSNVARSANWIKMEYQNQKASQTLIGHLVQSGTALAVTPTSIQLREGSSTVVDLTAQAGGAQKMYWVEKRNGVDKNLATDTFTLPVTAGRVSGTQNYLIQFQAYNAGVARTVNVPVSISEDLPDPVFTLSGPSTWDGRQTITVTPNLSNLPSLQAKGVANLVYNWSVAGCAVNQTTSTATPTVPGAMTLTRSQGSGPLTITLVLDNGGARVTQTKTIAVTEPSTDLYALRTPGIAEIPVTGQFYARNPKTNLGTIYYNGTESSTATSVFLKVYSKTETGPEVLYATKTQALVGGRYQFSVPVAPGLVQYKVVYGRTNGGVDTIVNTVTDLVCGDAYIFEGQSNAFATDGLPQDVRSSPWIRTYKRIDKPAEGDYSGQNWAYALRKSDENPTKPYTIGYFAYELAVNLTTQHNIPICIINGSAGGTRVDQHQPNPAGRDVFLAGVHEIYPNLLKRVTDAKLTHGIRGILWHQGENNSGAEAPNGDFDYLTYQQYFMSMSAGWIQDYPNIEHYVVFQVMPRPCSMGPKGDQLRDVQRTLPLLYSKMDILNTLANTGYIGCHFTIAGYKNMADVTLPVANHRFYGIVPPAPITAPILKRAYSTNAARTSIALVFDQTMSWSSFSARNFYIDKEKDQVLSGSASGNIVTLRMKSAVAPAASLTYLMDDNWSYNETTSTLLYGANAIAALTFADVPIEVSASASQTITFGSLPNKDYLDAPFALAATASSGLPVSYSSSDPLVASISGGIVTILKPGSLTITASQDGDPNYSAAPPVTQSLTVNPASFLSWAANQAQSLTAGVNNGPLDDPDGDGIFNLMEFALGGAPVVSSQAILPKLAKNGESWVFEYDRSNVSQEPATVQVVEYGSDLTGWTPVTIPTASAGIVTITPGSASERVTVTLPAGGNQVFARLKVSQP